MQTTQLTCPNTAFGARTNGRRRAAFLTDFLLLLLALSAGCDASHLGDKTFRGTGGARFYAVGSDDVLYQALTSEDSIKFKYEKTAVELGVGSLPATQLRAECISKIADVGGVPSAVLVEPKSNLGVVWSEHDKITIKHTVVVNDSQVRVTDTDIIVGGSVSIVHTLTSEQFKEALIAFKNNPCAEPKADK